MKKTFYLFAIAIVFASCSQPTSDTSAESGSSAIMTTDGVRYVYDSPWTAQTLSDLTGLYNSRAVDSVPTPDELTEIVDTLNDKSQNIQYFITTEETTIEESPECILYAVDENVDPDTRNYYVLQKWTLDRSLLSTELWRYKLDATALGGLLYVDHVPAVPEPVIDNRDPYEKYAIYAVITETGKIYLEEHCQDAWDEVYSKETNCMYSSVKDYFNHRVASFVQEAVYSGWTIYSGEIYTEPEETTE